MKRDGEWDSGDGYDNEAKRRRDGPGEGGASTSSRCFMKVLATDDLTGYLLAEHGARKLAIMQDSGCRLHFSNKGDYYPGTSLRVLGIFGPDVQAIVRALEQLLLKISELAEEDKTRAPPPGSELAGDEPGEVIFRLCLTNNTTGLLIGSHGSNIDQLRQETGTKITVHSDSMVGHRSVQVSGTVDAVHHCLERIQDYVQREVDTEEFQRYMSIINFSEVSGGAPPGRRGYEAPDSWSSRKGAPAGGAGPPMAGKGGRAGPVHPRVNDGVAELGREIAGLPQGTAMLSYSISCYLPAHLVGALVGRGGEFVRRVEDETGAKVDISKHSDSQEDDGLRQMCCVGGLAAVYAAHAMMMRRLQETESGTAPEIAAPPPQINRPPPPVTVQARRPEPRPEPRYEPRRPEPRRPEPRAEPWRQERQEPEPAPPPAGGAQDVSQMMAMIAKLQQELAEVKAAQRQG